MIAWFLISGPKEHRPRPFTPRKSGLLFNTFYSEVKTWAVPAPQHKPGQVRGCSLRMFVDT